MTPTTSQYHAVVLGGSMAGLLAARVLSNHFDHVTIVERDPVHDQPEFAQGPAPDPTPARSAGQRPRHHDPLLPGPARCT